MICGVEIFCVILKAKLESGRLCFGQKEPMPPWEFGHRMQRYLSPKI